MYLKGFLDIINSVNQEINSLFRNQIHASIYPIKGVLFMEIVMKKPNYIKEPNRDLSNLKKIVNPDLKKRNDKLFKVLVDNLNRNVLKHETDHKI